MFDISQIALAGLVLSIIASAHIVLHKRDSRAAIGWVGIVWLVPFVGAGLYYLLGINRIRRRATRLRPASTPTYSLPMPVESISSDRPKTAENLQRLVQLGDALTGTRLTSRNCVTTLVGGEAAFADMIDAIDRARQFVVIATYIFDHDPAGLSFVDALERAQNRGVEVRVLIDGLGSYYSRPPITRILRARNIPCAKFMHSILPWRMAYLNLRSHRKLLIADGRVAFTGGMNLRAGHLLHSAHRRPIRDVQFRLEGPVVGQLTEIFAQDWRFTTGEKLNDPFWFPVTNGTGAAQARAVVSGPDEEIERMTQLIMGALSQATHTVRIATPYFLPDRPLVSALILAALRGVRVELIIPQRNNLPVVHWATMAQIDHIIGQGVRVWLSPPPFDHSKLLVVDDSWCLIGSANWDTRSLRLNFELNVEIYDTPLASEITDLIVDQMNAGEELTREKLAARSIPAKLRDGTASLFSPYL